MSRFQKIFLATALVVVGFGVAKFLGQPVRLPESLRAFKTQPQAAPIATQTADVNAATSRTANSVQLLPDMPVSHADIPSARAASNMPEVPALGTALAPLTATSDSPSSFNSPRALNFPPIASSTFGEAAAPRATLRNEAPRPVGVDPQSPAAIRRAPPVGDAAADPYKVTNAPPSAMTWPAPQLMNASYADATPSQTPTAIAASYNQPVTALPESQLAPPPWPAQEESAAEPRTHIIVDGDTLEKLAGRYLTDPARSHEIYELNRDVLSNPDLLPIGAELKLPERVASTARDRQSWQPNSSAPKPSAQANHNNITIAPVRPAFAPQEIIPRAQLARPVMVE